MNAVANITDMDLHVEGVTGADKNIDVVVDIFNKLNSKGTRLSKGDLALAKVCAEWPEARSEMNRRLEKWQDARFSFQAGLVATVRKHINDWRSPFRCS